MTTLAVDADLARVGRVRPRQGVHQRRLAGAVPTDEGDHLAGVEVDADAVDGVHATERHTDVAKLDERGHALAVLGSGWWRDRSWSCASRLSRGRFG